MAKLIMNPSSGARKEIPVMGRILSIGRDPSNDLVLSDSMVSRRHAILEQRGDVFVLRDNNSSNGTLVNGDRVSDEHPVRDGDLIAIGACRLLFQADSSGTLGVAPAEPQAQAPSPQSPQGSPTGCAACGGPIQLADRFCRQCGKPLPPPARHVICSACGSSVPHPANFCAVCGKPLLRDEQRRIPTQPLQRSAATEGLVVPAGSMGGAAPEPPKTPARNEAAPPRGPEAPPVPGPSPVAAPELPPLPPIPPAVATPPPAARVNGPRASVKPGPRSVPGHVPVVKGRVEESAGFWIRLVAYLIDAIILGIPLAILMGVVGFALAAGTDSPGSSIFILIQGVATLGSFGLGAAYLLYFWAVHGWTPGKKILGLAIMTSGGDSPIGFGRALLRLLGYFVNGLTLGIGFLLIAFSREKLGLHDRIAETRVVHRR